MTAAMMAPVIAPALWRWRRAAAKSGARRPTWAAVQLAAGYFAVWTLAGIGVWALGEAWTVMVATSSGLGGAGPLAAAALLLGAGTFQLSKLKDRRLAACRDELCCAGPITSSLAWREGLRLGRRCSECCAGLTAAMLAFGLMDLKVMLAAGAAIALERLAPGGRRLAQATGAAILGAGAGMAVFALGLAG